MSAHRQSEATETEPPLSTEEQLALAIEALSEHVVLFDAEDRVVLANKAWREFNKDVAEFTKPGTRFEDHLRAILGTGLVPDASSREEDWLRERMERHLNPSGPFEVLRQDGRWIRIHEQRLPNNGTILIIGDITEQKRAEQALLDSERKFRNLFQNATSGIGRTRIKDGKVLLANSRFSKIFGYESAEQFMADFKFSDHYLTKDSRRETLENYEKYPDKVHEVTFTKRDGSLVYTEAEVRIDREQGVIDFVIIDVTERHLAQSALLESEQNYRWLFENAAVGIGRDRVIDGEIMIANQKLAEMFGFDSPEALISEYNFIDAYIEKDQQARLVSSLEENPVQISEQKFAKRDGSVVTVLGYDKLHPGGEWIDYIAIDITELKTLEEQLRQSQKMEVVGHLAGGVAHDFNNLLAVIQNCAEHLQDEPCHDVDIVETIIRASDRGAELTHRLLAFSRLQPLQTKSLDLTVLTGGMSDLLKRTLGETIEIENIAEAGLWPAAADPGQVENALLNLSINARDALPDGGKLTIECQNVLLDEAYVAENPEASAGDFVKLSVSDNGTGMTPEVLEHAFEPFFTTKEVGEGSGLGLSMVYGFAKQSGGHAVIQSEEGQGTRVELYLPRHEVVAQRVGGDATREIPRGRDQAVLIVEDDPEVRKLSVKTLETLGYRVTGAPQAAAARALLESGEKFDLMLSDVVLPGGMSGPEFAEEATERFPGLKVLFMSGYPAEAAKRDGSWGSDSVLLNKPFRRSQLAKAVRDALD